MLGRYDEAMVLIDKQPASNLRDYLLALLHRVPGKQQEADAALARLAAAPRRIPDMIRLAEVHADRGESDTAFDLQGTQYREVERNRAARPRDLWFFQDEIRTSPYLRPLQADARWDEVATIPD
jgi:hypothetical protein